MEAAERRSGLECDVEETLRHVLRKFDYGKVEPLTQLIKGPLEVEENGFWSLSQRFSAVSSTNNASWIPDVKRDGREIAIVKARVKFNDQQAQYRAPATQTARAPPAALKRLFVSASAVSLLCAFCLRDDAHMFYAVLLDGVIKVDVL
ncbi:hypothetical protein EVAR_103584_1 [Eumeta japonica]|uniref:Uncharacterized protein n=1 Tax=Eumeta variegata TaxID=151549 RepID=A0A4C1ZZ42_EUMVA|nr:hypothetical protein EVAR_103584_1 [Eumeta japonica]